MKTDLRKAVIDWLQLSIKYIKLDQEKFNKNQIGYISAEDKINDINAIIRLIKNNYNF